MEELLFGRQVGTGLVDLFCRFLNLLIADIEQRYLRALVIKPFGNCPANHTIAVDPRVIPYGSKVMINGVIKLSFTSFALLQNGHGVFLPCSIW